ncbi:MAG: hydantoinase/oxoprolinase family protein [Candidatus Binatia bacterium]
MLKNKYILGVDTGGTFTDVTILGKGGDTVIGKSTTTPDDFSRGVMDAIEVTGRSMGLSLKDLLTNTSYVKHGTTVGTNALITRTGSKVGFITTAGFEDTTMIMRGVGRIDGLSEEEIKHMAKITKPAPLVPKTLIRGVHERVDYRGRVVVPINLEETKQAIRSLVEEEQVEAVAVSFIFGWCNPVHERKVRELARQMYPESKVYFTFAHELMPVVGEYSRANTVITNSFLGRTMVAYVGDLSRKLRDSGLRSPLMIMQANGGITNFREMVPITTLQSGPAGGMIATKYMADLLGHKNVISTDMGGTSFDVGLINDGFWYYLREPIAQRYRFFQPMIDIESIGAGGGTIARVEATTGRLLVGPQSAGAHPGPVAYDTGGEEVTVTDANLLLGYLDPEFFLGGKQKLNLVKAEKAVREKIAKPLGLDVVEAAAGVHQVVNSQMVDLIRKQVVRRGHIPEEYVVYVFGGAGPVHAAGYASGLGIKKTYIFPTSSVFSAFGIAAADVIHSRLISERFLMPADPVVLNRRLETVEEDLLQLMTREGFSLRQVSFRRTFYMRYHRQMNDVGIQVPTKRYGQKDMVAIETMFEKEYEKIYGTGATFRAAGTEIISIGVDAIGNTLKPRPKRYPSTRGHARAAVKGYRKIFFTSPRLKSFKTAIYDYQKLRPGHRFEGPAVVETPITTVVVPPEKVVRIDPFLNIEMAV